MKTTEFQDCYNNHITLQYSSGGDIRIYFKDPEGHHSFKDKMGNSISPCILLDPYKCQIMISGLQDLLEGLET